MVPVGPPQRSVMISSTFGVASIELGNRVAELMFSSVKFPLIAVSKAASFAWTWLLSRVTEALRSLGK